MITRDKQSGVTLVIAILFLLILTIISVFAATNSTLELKMSGNMQDSLVSFQTAEAGARAVLALAGTDEDNTDPFSPQPIDAENKGASEWVTTWGDANDGVDGIDPFRPWAGDDSANHPLNAVTDTIETITSTLTMTVEPIEEVRGNCPRQAAGSSSQFLVCGYYNIQVAHNDPGKARTEVNHGVVKTFLSP